MPTSQPSTCPTKPTDTFPVWLGLGSNQGSRHALLLRALSALSRLGALSHLSTPVETAPWGYDSPHPFVNMVAQLHTALSPKALLAEIKSIERAMGRIPRSAGAGYADRPIDIDILFYADRVIHTPDLVIPHPLLHLRAFVLRPMDEVAPDWVHPVLGHDIHTLLQAL